jgi:hypothetical protein
VQRGVGAVEDLGVVLVGIVDEQDVDAVQAKALEARRDRAQDAVAAVVAPAPVRRGHGEALVVVAGHLGDRLEQPSDLRGQDELVTRALGERGADAPLGEAEPVVRRGVEVAHAELPRRVDGRARIRVGRGAVEIAELGTAQSQARQLDAGVPDRAALREPAHPMLPSSRSMTYCCAPEIGGLWSWESPTRRSRRSRR